MSESAIRNDSIGVRAGALALLMAVLWGGNTVAIKAGLVGLPPAAMAALRFIIGALTVWVGALFVGIPVRVPRAVWKGLAGLGYSLPCRFGCSTPARSIRRRAARAYL